jgi:hypothetical protein
MGMHLTIVCVWWCGGGGEGGREGECVARPLL